LTIVSNTGQGPVSGFVHREQQALITGYLNFATMFIRRGYEMALMVGGDFWVVNNGTTQALPQGQGQAAMKAYANLSNGLVTFAPSGQTTSSATSTSSSIAATTTTFQGSISGDVLTVTVAPATPLVVGAILTGTAGTIPTNTQVISQLGGTTGGVGTYLLSNPEVTYPTAGGPAAGTITASWGVLTVGGTLTGTFGVNGLLSGSGVVANTYITALGTGLGGAGTYIVNNGAGVGAEDVERVEAVIVKRVPVEARRLGDAVHARIGRGVAEVGGQDARPLGPAALVILLGLLGVAARAFQERCKLGRRYLGLGDERRRRHRGEQRRRHRRRLPRVGFAHAEAEVSAVPFRVDAAAIARALGLVDGPEDRWVETRELTLRRELVKVGELPRRYGRRGHYDGAPEMGPV
jgi:hypothetical protein